MTLLQQLRPNGNQAFGKFGGGITPFSLKELFNVFGTIVI